MDKTSLSAILGDDPDDAQLLARFLQVRYFNLNIYFLL